MNNFFQIERYQALKYVTSGMLASSSQKELISTSPLGSCVAVIAYDKQTKIGGIAHIMLPGKAPPNKKNEENKYTKNAIVNLFMRLTLLGATMANIEICLVGGANVLRKENDNIAENLVSCVVDFLERLKITIKEKSLGGYERRSVSLNTATGVVCYTIGDSAEKILWNFSEEKVVEYE